MDEFQSLYGALAAYTRMQLGLSLLPWSDAPSAKELNCWLGDMLSIDRLTDERSINLNASLRTDLQRLTWQIQDDFAYLVMALGRYLTNADVAEAGLKLLERIGEEVEPTRAGAWMEAKQSNLNVGWFLPTPFPSEQAFTFVEENTAAGRVREWSRTAGIQTCEYFSRSLGTGASHTETQFALPGDTAEQQLEHSLALFDALGVEGAPDEMLAALLQYAGPNLHLAVALSDTGLSKVALRAMRPSTMLVLQLCRIAGTHSTETLATFESAMGTDGANSVDVEQLADGYYVTVNYSPAYDEFDEAALEQEI